MNEECQFFGRCVLVWVHNHGETCGRRCTCVSCVKPRVACQDLTDGCGHLSHQAEAKRLRVRGKG